MGNALDSGFWEGLGLGVGGGAPNAETGFGEGWLVCEGVVQGWIRVKWSFFCNKIFLSKSKFHKILPNILVRLDLDRGVGGGE